MFSPLSQRVKGALVKYTNFKLKITPELSSAALAVFDGTQALFTQKKAISKGLFYCENSL